ncbi:YnfA family protein [Desulfoscipio geothermicus]|uniref:Small multidrug resistance family-3 protein n=1 Tax=Desulfoscipio geothermicus DSM 3669 TaxID=1121426 RepID=A0A1I6E099_9FIRM|nr:YnfA family protein [Desulfoscipio geothermicus]SFR11170.1 small multidrug resistance family-3 protein [Desulfoscipio geothermicus DSM 3669]
MFFRSISLFFLAGLAEILGGYFIWIWLRDGASVVWGLTGGIILIAYGVIPTLQNFPDFGRIYAAYGGVFIIMSILWGWWIDGVTPDFYDWLGTFVALIGTAIILWYPRKGQEKEAAGQ